MPRLLYNIIWKLERRGRGEGIEIKHQKYKFHWKKKKRKPRKVYWGLETWLGALLVLTEDLCSVPST